MSEHPAGQTIATALHELREDLPPSEGRVARTLLEGYPVAGIGTLAELAERARVSSPTVLRLVNRLGFVAFGDFQRALLAEVEERLATTASSMPAAPTAADGHLARTLLREAAENVAADAEALLAGEIDEVVDLIATGSRHVVLIGGWLTRTVAEYLYRQLRLLRPRCRCLGWSPSPESVEVAALGRRDTLVVFDFRPYEAASEQLAAFARRRGVRIVLFTDEWLSPIARLASHVLVSRCASSSPFDSFAATFALAEAVAASVAVRLGPDARRRIAESEAVLGGWSWTPADAHAGNGDS